MATLKELSKSPELLSGGHRLCAGCGAPIILRLISHVIDKPLVVGCATGCVEVSTTIYPYTAWKCSFIHNAFENSAATISGVETAYRALKKKGKIKEEFRFLALGGDGGIYDIGFQSLSGAMERGHRMVAMCYDNEAYMNTGIQRSSATPFGADTTTQPAGKVVQGKTRFPKDLTGIMVAHRVPYVAQSTPAHWNDLTTKAKKAFDTEGPAFLNILSPCPPGWRTPSEQSIELSRIAVDTCFWPLYEVERGAWKLNYKPKTIRPIMDWIAPQGRFKHLLRPENKHIVDEIQEYVTKNWNDLLKKCGEPPSP